MFWLWFDNLGDELTADQKADIELAADCIFNPIYDLHSNMKLMQNEKVIAKYDKLCLAAINFIDTVYTYDVPDIRESAHELKKAISNFGYHAKKVDKRATGKINNIKFKRNIDALVNYIEDALTIETEEDMYDVLQLSC